jgi:protein TonB
MRAFRKKKQQSASLDDLVFEHRNKEYGSYYLRTTYDRRLRFSVLLVLSFSLLVTLLLYLWEINPWHEPLEIADNSYSDSIQYESDRIHIYNPMVVPPALPVVSDKAPERAKSTELASESNIRKDIPLAKTIPITIPLMDTSLKKQAEDLLQRHKKNLDKEKSLFADSLSIILERPPLFPDGYAAIQSYFYKNQHYPEYALSRGIHGSPVVSFIVNKAGVVEKVKIVNGVDPGLDREAIRLVTMMPRWQPAYYKGNPIACMLIMPVDFTIK